MSDLQIVKQKNGFFVQSEEGEILNEKPFKTRAEAVKYMKKMMKTHELAEKPDMMPRPGMSQTAMGEGAPGMMPGMGMSNMASMVQPDVLSKLLGR